MDYPIEEKMVGTFLCEENPHPDWSLIQFWAGAVAAGNELNCKEKLLALLNDPAIVEQPVESKAVFGFEPNYLFDLFFSKGRPITFLLGQLDEVVCRHFAFVVSKSIKKVLGSIDVVRFNRTHNLSYTKNSFFHKNLLLRLELDFLDDSGILLELRLKVNTIGNI